MKEQNQSVISAFGASLLSMTNRKEGERIVS